MEQYTQLQQQLITAIAAALRENNQYSDYKLFKNYLRTTKQYSLICVLSDNRYLYGSLVKAAQLLTNA